MFNLKITDVTTDALIELHGANAGRIINGLIQYAINRGRPDEALELDRVRREVETRLAA